jgi:hypothetical protein
MSSDNDKLVLNALFNPNTPLDLDNPDATQQNQKKSGIFNHVLRFLRIFWFDFKIFVEYDLNEAIEQAKNLEQQGN